MTNLERPAVLRQYFGCKSVIHPVYDNIEYRHSYGVGNGSACMTVGSDLGEVTTRRLEGELLELSKLVYDEINCNSYIQRGLFSKRRQRDLIKCKPFNHVTVLLYFTRDGIRTQSKLSAHCDCTYDKFGKFRKNMNSQVENSVTASLTIGQKRVINFYARSSEIISESKRGNWKKSNKIISLSTLHDGDIMLIHPDDEKPFFVDGGKNGQMVQIQHGNVKIEKNKLSVGFLFRQVDNIQCYDKKSNTMVNHRNKTNHIQSDVTRKFIKKNLNINKDLLHMLEKHLQG